MVINTKNYIKKMLQNFDTNFDTIIRFLSQAILLYRSQNVTKNNLNEKMALKTKTLQSKYVAKM